MTRRHGVACFLAFVSGLGVAGCSQLADAPGAPSAAAGSTSSATSAPRVVELASQGSDLPTLKASVPAVTSPAEGSTIEGNRATLVVSNARGLFVNVGLNLEIQVWEISGDPPNARLISSDIVPQSASGSTAHAPAVDLERGTQYQARARALLSGAVSPWSPIVSFETAAPVETSSGADDINPYEVAYLHRNIAGWTQTSTITGITIGSSEICVFHTGAGQFPQSPFGDIDVEGNIWVFAQFGGKWHGATWDWLRPGQECKGEGVNSLGPEQIRVPPMDGGWRPQSGSPICFAISARARDEVEAGLVRTNIACTTVP